MSSPSKSLVGPKCSTHERAKKDAQPSPSKFQLREFVHCLNRTHSCPSGYDNFSTRQQLLMSACLAEPHECKTGSATRRPVCRQNWKERCQRLEARTLGSCSPWWTHPLPHGQTASRCSPLQHSRIGFSHITQPHKSLRLQHSHTSPHDFNTATQVLVTSTQSYKSLWL